jgi:AhpD family alkylhydroperoxidase
MAKNYKEITGELLPFVTQLHKDLPGVMQAFSSMGKAATEEKALDKKTKELIAIALAVANHCEGCIGFHVQTLVKLGVSREALVEALGMAIYMGGGPSVMYAAEALRAFADLS